MAIGIWLGLAGLLGGLATGVGGFGSANWLITNYTVGTRQPGGSKLIEIFKISLELGQLEQGI